MLPVATPSLPVILTEKLPQIKETCHRFGVKRLYVFGSATSNRFNENSDIDFLVSFKKLPEGKLFDNFFDLKYYFESLFNRKIDLIFENALSNPYFIKTVEDSKLLIYDYRETKVFS